MRALSRSLAITMLLAASTSATSFAQTTGRRPIPYPVVPPPAFQRAIEQGTRSTTGKPGPSYWQNWTHYTLRARLVPDEKRLEGSGRIVFHNRSPDELPALALYTALNLHAEGAIRNEPAEVTGGVKIERLAVAGTELADVTRGEMGNFLAYVPLERLPQILRAAAQRDSTLHATGACYLVSGTNLAVVLPHPLAAGDSVEIAVDWSLEVPQHGAGGGRMGWAGDNLFHIAYWYPQIAVYDDVVGWQLDPFLSNSEFYMGYGDYDVTVEVPEGWVVGGTGLLLNPEEVLAPPVLERYRRAATSDSVVHVLGESDLGPGVATLRSPDGYLRWRLRADSVRDVAFSVMRESRWDAARTPAGDRDGDGVTDYARVNSYWRAGAPLWREEWRYAAHAIAALSRWTGFPYPWPQVTAVEGGGLMGGGMEYPMMTLMGAVTYPGASDTALYGLTAHELGHMWFPMIVGTDERRYAWMDEGTTSFNAGFATDEFFPGRVVESGAGYEGYLSVARAGAEGEMMRWSDYHYPGPAYGTASYSKSTVLLRVLRALLGPETFDPAWRDYVRSWAFKHPKPWDFFNSFNSAAGKSLDWFWRAWYYETWTLDQAVGRVSAERGGTTIVIEDRGWVPMPARVTITRENGEALKREVPVETWLGGATSAELQVPRGAPVVRVEIDPEFAFPDIDRANNVWAREPGR